MKKFKLAPTEEVVAPILGERTLLLDGDLAIFSICAACEYGAEEGAVNFNDIARAIDGKFKFLQNRVGASKMRVFLTDSYNFRTTIMEEYKANRDDVWRPYHLKNAQAYVRAYFDAESVVGLEADDLMAIHQKTDGTTIIATIDKDLLQLAGDHYKWETQHAGEEFITVSGFGDLRVIEKKSGKTTKKEVKGQGPIFFCHQLLIGDGTDGVIGCGVRESVQVKTGAKAGEWKEKRVGVGAVTSYELLKKTTSYKEALQKVILEYKKVFGDKWEHNLLRNGRALFMTRKMVEENGENLIRLWHWRGVENVEWLNLSTKELVVR